MSCTRALAFGLLLVLCGSLSACELVADFDRSKLDAAAEGPLDASVDEDSSVGSVTIEAK